MISSQPIQANAGQIQFVYSQLSYSTVDIEKSVFFDEKFAPVKQEQELEKTTIVVVNGEVYELKDEPYPSPAVPLTEEAGIFRIMGLDEQK